MKRHVITLLACVALTLGWGAGTAAADDPPSAQLAGQAAESGQAAGAGSEATQSQPTNQNISVRVLSPGSDGDVTQSNTVSSDASATNANLTGQSADQTQSDGGVQVAGQDASSWQLAGALSSASQYKATNKNVAVRVLSPGDGGNVTQSNSVDSGATALNANATKQDVDQDQAGGRCSCAGGDGIQTADQSASNEQAALAKSDAVQKDATNTNISVRVLSPGKDGDVTQSNTVSSSATAANLNLTKQDADQSQSGGREKCGCDSGPAIQVADQKADSEQLSGASSAAKQEGASNSNNPVRVLSPGSSGHVTQTNSVASSATAANLNTTKQDADQDRAGSGSGIQWIGQSASNGQAALAGSAAIQKGASNTNTPVRVLSPGREGDVTQTNSVSSTATALNLNATKQDADQDQAGGRGHECGCDSGSPIQLVKQDADNEQGALAGSIAVQEQHKGRCGCSAGGNTNAPVLVHSPGYSHKGGGDVTQSNGVSSTATAANLNATKQDADQSQWGGREKCGCDSGPEIQVIGQEASSEQGALARSAALQLGASNTNRPTRVYSPGGDGDVSQTNTVDSSATAANLNLTKQDADQSQAGGRGHGCGCDSGPSIQVIGQKASNEQLAGAHSAAFQLGASNTNSPTRVYSPGGGHGDVTQSNDVSSTATAANLNATRQDADQRQWGGGSCCGGVGIQAIGQTAWNGQAASAGSLGLQLGSRGKCGCSAGGNTNAPVLVHSRGYSHKGGGDVTQSNTVSSAATAANLNLTHQDADQSQWGSGISIQALGQAAGSFQLSGAESLAAQLAGGNQRR